MIFSAGILKKYWKSSLIIFTISFASSFLRNGQNIEKLFKEFPSLDIFYGNLFNTFWIFWRKRWRKNLENNWNTFSILFQYFGAKHRSVHPVLCQLSPIDYCSITTGCSHTWPKVFMTKPQNPDKSRKIPKKYQKKMAVMRDWTSGCNGTALDALNNTWHWNIEKILKKYSNYFQDFFCIFFSKRPQEYWKDFYKICPNKEILKDSSSIFCTFFRKKDAKDIIIIIVRATT